MKDKTDAELIEEAESVALVRFVWSDDERRARVLARELARRLKAANESLFAARQALLTEGSERNRLKHLLMTSSTPDMKEASRLLVSVAASCSRGQAVELLNLLQARIVEIADERIAAATVEQHCLPTRDALFSIPGTEPAWIPRDNLRLKPKGDA